ncbi:MAG: arylsulfatase [Bryobacteraceae bacterium]|nr:arylsulfatase [Bryobacteraceae bacterium]
MTRREMIGALGAPFAVPAPLNIVLIVADDLGYGDLGCFGQKRIATPNLDRLAAEGTRFTEAYAGSSVCAPSRCCLMTGLHTGHTHIRGNHAAGGERVSLRATDRTFPEAIRKAGYRTAACGKWGIGEAGTAGTPNDKGFERWFGFLNQDHALDYYPTHLWRNRSEWFPPGNQGAKRNQSAQALFTDFAVDFVRTAVQPYLLFAAYATPHASSEVGRDTGDGFPVSNYGEYAAKDWPRPEKGYAALVTELDRDVGRIVAEIDRLGQRDRTLIFFTSDNGPARDGGHTPEFFGSAAGFRGRKGDLYEGGLRVPLIARWPGTVPAGKECAQPVAFWDFFPTLAELAGAAVPPGLDGRSFVPQLKGAPPQERGPLYWELPGKRPQRAVRFGPWKAVQSENKLELFDLSGDPAESRDLAGSRPAELARARDLLAKLRTPSPIYDRPEGKS